MGSSPDPSQEIVYLFFPVIHFLILSTIQIPSHLNLNCHSFSILLINPLSWFKILNSTGYMTFSKADEKTTAILDKYMFNVHANRNDYRSMIYEAIWKACLNIHVFTCM